MDFRQVYFRVRDSDTKFSHIVIIWKTARVMFIFTSRYYESSANMQCLSLKLSWIIHLDLKFSALYLKH